MAETEGVPEADDMATTLTPVLTANKKDMPTPIQTAITHLEQKNDSLICTYAKYSHKAYKAFPNYTLNISGKDIDCLTDFGTTYCYQSSWISCFESQFSV